MTSHKLYIHPDLITTPLMEDEFQFALLTRNLRILIGMRDFRVRFGLSVSNREGELRDATAANFGQHFIDGIELNQIHFKE